MYFIDYLCDLSKREGHSQYISNIRRDLPRIIDLVAPGTKAGAMNIKVVVKVLHNLEMKGILTAAEVEAMTAQLAERSQEAEISIANPGSTGLVDRSDGINELDNEGIEQRMEEDRERHKRLREDAWAVDTDKEVDALLDAANRATGLTVKLAQDSNDDGREKAVAIDLDEGRWEEERGKEKADGDGDVEMT